jgi:Uma2 family endonuclease
MATVEERVPPLVPGARLTREEFLRRWEAMPQVKFAELIGGIVYMPSPLRRSHSFMDRRVNLWLGHYELLTPGCGGGNNATWLMLDDAPQPDLDLCILPEYGGQSGMQGNYAKGAAEFLAEISISSADYDLHEKLDLYRAAGVREYLVVLPEAGEVRWHRLVGDTYQLLSPGPDGVLRSVVFPGLWLHAQALLEGNMPLVMQTLQEGLASPEHAQFVADLARRRG